MSPLTTVRPGPALRRLGRRLALLAATLLLASVVVFVVLRVLPGDSAGAILGAGTTAPQLESLRHELGTDRPWSQQYASWIGSTLRGDLGTSFVSRLPVSTLIAAKLQVTLPLSLAAFALAILLAVPVGVAAALRRRHADGAAVSALAQLGIAVPSFWIGIVLIWLFALRWHLLPANGFPTGGWSDPWAVIRCLTLPVLTIALVMGATLVRYVRSATLDVLDSEHVRAAVMLGFSPRRALARHGLRSAAAPVVQILGIELISSLLGAVVIENVFALPGLGSLLLSSVEGRDLPVVQALVLLTTALVLVVNALVDVLQQLIDPRLAREAGA